MSGISAFIGFCMMGVGMLFIVPASDISSLKIGIILLSLGIFAHVHSRIDYIKEKNGLK